MSKATPKAAPPSVTFSASSGPLKGRRITVTETDPATLVPNPRNPRSIDPEARALLKEDIVALGIVDPLVVRAEDRMILGGHQRHSILVELGAPRVPTFLVHDLTDAEATAINIALNNERMQGDFDPEKLGAMMRELRDANFPLQLLGFGEDTDSLLAGSRLDGPIDVPHTQLAESFLGVPFSVFNAREGWWQDRKRAWIALGIQSELGRGDGSEPGGSKMPARNKETGKIARGEHRARMIPGTDAKGKGRKATAIPGGGTGKSSAYLFKTKKGYQTPDQIAGKPKKKRTAP